MDDQIVAIYTIVNDLLQGMNHHEDRQCRMNDSEVLTTGVVAALFFGGRFETARRFLQERGYIPAMLSKSRFSRRIHRISRFVPTLVDVLGEHWKGLNKDSIYAIDTFPVPVCDNWRIRRCRLYQDKAYRGYISSKRRYYYGLKLHLMVTAGGQPVEFFFTPGSASDVTHLKSFQFDLPDGSEVYADRIYNDYAMEDLINESQMVTFRPIRKKNSKRPYPPWQTHWIKTHRKIVETAGASITRRMPRTIQAVTSAGFELKIALFILAESFSHLFKVAT